MLIAQGEHPKVIQLRPGHSSIQVTLQFHDVDVTMMPESGPPAWLVRGETELLYDEIETLPDGRFEWRAIAWPQGELAIDFADVSLSLMPIGDADR
jgi:hypothetical protein